MPETALSYAALSAVVPMTGRWALFTAWSATDW